MPTRQLARIAVLLAVAALASPAAASAQQAPSLGAPAQTETAPVVTPTENPSDRGLQTWQELLIFAAGVVLLGGIAWAIVGDARNRAPVRDRRHRPAPDDPVASRLSPHERRRRKERARAKARAARAARKRTKRAR